MIKRRWTLVISVIIVLSNLFLLSCSLISANTPQKEPGPEITLTPALNAPTLTITASSGQIIPCQKINSASQVDYLGILPGFSTTDNLIELIGKPVEILTYEGENQEWIYESNESGFFPIRIENDIVVSITLPSDPKNRTNLREIFQKYGCPDIIFAIDFSEHKSGQYSATSLVYLDYGIEFTIEAFPLTLSDEISTSLFFKPGTLDDFLSYNPSLKSELVAKIITLEEAIKR